MPYGIDGAMRLFFFVKNVLRLDVGRRRNCLYVINYPCVLNRSKGNFINLVQGEHFQIWS